MSVRRSLLLLLLVIGAAGSPIHFGRASADAASCPPIVFGAANASLDELAVRTLAGLFDEDGRYESGGFFIEMHDAYQASAPVTQHARRAVNYCIVLPRGARLAGIYHTHVASATLSVPDRRNAERAGVPSYIGTIRERSVLVYDARHGEVRALESTVVGDRANAVATAERSEAIQNVEGSSLHERLVALKRRAVALLDEVSKRF